MIIPEPEDPNVEIVDAPKGGKIERLQENSLRIAGVGQVLADTALMAYGAATGNMKVGSVGLLGWTTGSIGMRYGNPKSEKQLELVERQLGKYLRRQGVKVPKDPTAASLMQHGGIIENVESFMYAYPTQLMNVCLGLMGVQFTRSGVQHNQKALMASGVLLMAGALAGLLIPDKNPDPENPPHGTLQKAWSWIQENPLRLSGTLFNLNQVTLTVDALQERKRNPQKKAYMFKLAAVAGFVLFNTMMAMSSKGQGGGAQMDDETRGKLAEAACHIITSQPKDVQEELLDHISGYLSAQPYIHMKADKISAMLREKMTELGSQPQAGWQGRLAAATPPAQLSI